MFNAGQLVTKTRYADTCFGNVMTAFSPRQFKGLGQFSTTSLTRSFSKQGFIGIKVRNTKRIYQGVDGAEKDSDAESKSDDDFEDIEFV